MKFNKQDLKIFFYSDKEWHIDWYKNRKYHREDGPASISAYGYEYYCLDCLSGYSYNKEAYWEELHENY